jgi:hypothetical protein
MVIAFLAGRQCLFALAGVKFFDRIIREKGHALLKGRADFLELSVNQSLNRIGWL